MSATFHTSFDRHGRAIRMSVPSDRPDVQSAAEAYRDQQRVVLDLMTELSAKIMSHHTKQVADPKNWGYVGDLQHIAQQLREALGQE